MEVIDTLYTVTLQDCPDEVPERARAQAEARYAKALEQALGGPEEVAAALDTMSGLEGAADEDISQADLELAARWSSLPTCMAWTRAAPASNSNARANWPLPPRATHPPAPRRCNHATALPCC